MVTHLSYSNYSQQTEVTIQENTQALPISHPTSTTKWVVRTVVLELQPTHLLESLNKDLQLPPAEILKECSFETLPYRPSSSL